MNSPVFYTSRNLLKSRPWVMTSCYAVIFMLVSQLTYAQAHDDSYPATSTQRSVFDGHYPPVDSLTGRVAYEDVVQVSNVPATTLYSQAKRYFLKTFRNANQVIQVDEAGSHVGGRGVLKFYFKPVSNKALVSFGVAADYFVTIDIWVKDGRFKYRLDQFILTAPPIEMAVESQFASLIKQRGGADKLQYWNADVERFITNMVDFMRSTTKEKDW
jgi:hypothetical protein